jgi:hypothetical protein
MVAAAWEGLLRWTLGLVSVRGGDGNAVGVTEGKNGDVMTTTATTATNEESVGVVLKLIRNEYRYDLLWIVHDTFYPIVNEYRFRSHASVSFIRHRSCTAQQTTTTTTIVRNQRILLFYCYN